MWNEHDGHLFMTLLYKTIPRAAETLFEDMSLFCNFYLHSDGKFFHFEIHAYLSCFEQGRIPDPAKVPHNEKSGEIFQEKFYKDSSIYIIEINAPGGNKFS